MIVTTILTLLVAHQVTHARLIAYAVADAFVDERGVFYEWIQHAYRIRVDQAGERLYLNGFGMQNERVSAALGPRWSKRRNLVFESDDPKSASKPRLVIAANGFGSLYTRRLTRGRLALSAIVAVAPDFDARALEVRGLWRRDPCERRLR